MIIPQKLYSSLNQKQVSFLEDFFSKCPESLGCRVMVKAYQKNHTLISANDSCAHVYILLSGRLQAIEERIINEPYSFTELSAIEIVGDYELFTKLPARMVTLATLEKSLCLIIPAADYLAWIRNDANALFIRTQMLIRQLIAQSQFERRNFFLDNKTRLLHFLYSECEKQKERPFPILIKNTRQDIAGRMGCSLRTVNRTIKILSEEKVLDLAHGKMQIREEQYRKIKILIT